MSMSTFQTAIGLNRGQAELPESLRKYYHLRRIIHGDDGRKESPDRWRCQ